MLAGSISLEFFPPKNLVSERALMTGAHALRRFAPRFQTVTFGAGGEGGESSSDWAVQLQKLNGIPTACHLALSQFNQAGLFEFAEELSLHGVSHIVLVRGDEGEKRDGSLAGFASVADAALELKLRFGFEISVSAYPEKHPKAQSFAADLDVLRKKQDAGADRAITQYFFENDLFYQFRDRAVAAGISMELVPGIMPISSFSAVQRFSEKCGASVPERFESLYESTGDDNAKKTNLSRSIIEEQVRNLAQNDVDSIHIYTLNRVDLAADAIRAFSAEFPSEQDGQFRPALVG